MVAKNKKKRVFHFFHVVEYFLFYFDICIFLEKYMRQKRQQFVKSRWACFGSCNLQVNFALFISRLPGSIWLPNNREWWKVEVFRIKTSDDIISDVLHNYGLSDATRSEYELRPWFNKPNPKLAYNTILNTQLNEQSFNFNPTITGRLKAHSSGS